MSQQYLRKVGLLVGDATGQGLDLSELRIEFKVRQWDLQTPNSAFIRVWNLSEATMRQVQGEFTRVVLQAGYQDGPFGTIFDGSIIQPKRGRANATDTYLDIVAADGDQAYNFAVVNTSLVAGATPKDQVNAVVGAMGQHGVMQGYVPDLPANALPRGKVLHGMARDHLRDLGASTDTKWSIQNGSVQMVPLKGVLPGPAVVINSASGMIGIPEQTQEGIKVRTLLNPDIKMGRAVQINNADINRAQLDVSLQGQLQNAFLPRVTDDGFYRVIVAEQSGDTRGNDWYTDLICIALDDGVTPGLVSKGYG
jgi:hypothetical protein